MMFIPYEVDVPYDTRPVMNWLIVAALVVIFVLQIKTSITRTEKIEKQTKVGQQIDETQLKDPFEPYIMYGWTIKGLLGHMWLHGGLLHIAGNLIFLWLFGNAICSKIGNTLYLPIYILLGITAAAFHQTFTGVPAIGASGAINGVVGMYLVFFPENYISCVFVFFFPLLIRPYARTFSVSGIWMVLLWFAFDIWGLIRGGRNVAYWAHIGGFLAGFGLAILILKLKLITMEMYEKSLLQLIASKRAPVPEDYRKDIAYWQRDFIDTQQPVQTTLTQKPKPTPEPVPREQPPPKDKPATVVVKPAAKPEDRFVIMTCSCGKKLKVPLTLAGKTGICPKCKKTLKVPEKKFIRITCPCGKRFKVPAALAGKHGICPNCKSRLKISN